MKEIGKLVTKVQAGDAESFNLLVKDFQDMAVGYAYSILNDFHLAEDAAQEAFISAFREINKLREPEAFAGWFRRIVFTQCTRLIRVKSIPIVSLETLEVVSNEFDAEAKLEQKELRTAVMNAVKLLPEHERSAILLFFISGYNLREISDFLSIPLSTLKSRLHKAKSHLRVTFMEALKEDLRDKRPSAKNEFVDNVRRLLFQAAEGDAKGIARSLETDSSLVNKTGQHPFWGGEPQALHVAAEWGRRDAVELLLQKGADPNGANVKYDGWSPLHLAIHQDHAPAGHAEIVRILIDYGARIDIWAAAAMGNEEVVEGILMSEPELIHARGPNEASPLHFAATVEIVELLLEKGADAKALDKYGKTPARTIQSYGDRRKKAAMYLLDRTGEWDIFAACAVGDIRRAEGFINQNPSLLVESGPNGETPLNIAANHGQNEIVNLLLRSGADVNVKAKSGCYPLHLAARNGHLEVAKTLIKNQADLGVLDDYHQGTPRDWAEFQGQTEMAGFLKKQMKSR
ncbi:MAG: sigma-70 family RNA polymerase sigma factor [Pyrinomonadaceae bacterium]